MADALEGSEEGHIRLASVPGFKWHRPLQTLCRRAVQDEHHRAHHLAPECRRQLLCLEHAPRHPHDGLVPPLHHAILLSGIWRGEMVLDALFRSVEAELDGVELATTTSPQHTEFLPGLCLNARLEVPDRHRRLVLARQEVQPHVAATVVHQEEEVAPSAVRCQRNWSTKVPMDQL